jgi:3',5'-nucleoside bisphosphate phosphatase
VIILYKRGDFHSHSNASDGRLPPRELVNLAKTQGLDIISITDHDTVSGLEEAISQSSTIGIKVIPGIELSTLYNGTSVHVLGYFNNIDDIHTEFKAFLKDMGNYRIKRAKKIIYNLYKFFNIKLNYEDVLKSAHGIVARPHIAKAIIDAGYNYSFDYIFSNFIGENSPAYVPNKKLTTEEGISILKSMKAMTVLAHPVLIKKLNIEDVIKLPFDGIEAIYPANTDEDTFKFIDYANKYNKIISAGSDFHGLDEKDSKHGHYPGVVYLEEDRIELFLNKLNSMSK